MLSRAQMIENMNYWGDPRTISNMSTKHNGFGPKGQPNWSWLIDNFQNSIWDEECEHPILAEYENMSNEEYEATTTKISENLEAYFLDMLRHKFPSEFLNMPSLEDMIKAGEDLDYPVCAFNFEWQICGNCRGNGSHVNPAIDCSGITEEEWDRDWDEDSRHAYMSGRYDQTCNSCGGSGKVKMMTSNEGSFVNWILCQVNEADHSSLEMAREIAAERRWGC